MKYATSKRLFLILFLAVFSQGFGASSWAEKTLSEMSVEEKIGQLFMVAGYVDGEYAVRETENLRVFEEIEASVREYFVGGIGLVGPSSSVKQVEVLNRYQEMSKYPLLIAQDMEWGLSMRIADGMRFPKNITLGAIKDNDLVYLMGREIGRQGKLVGVHMNLSPDIDVNTEPENPVINVRSFGESPQNVAVKGTLMIQGLQDAGMIANAKHFPGLGRVTSDPHLGLPVNDHEKKSLEEIELYPFARAIEAGVLTIQTDHVLMPAFDTLPSSLSPKIVQEVLIEKMGFKGLVLSGALRMKALANHYSQEDIAVKAFKAGSDMLLMPQSLPKAYKAIQQALVEGQITQEEIDRRVMKILQLKERCKLHELRLTQVPTQEELHRPQARELKRLLYAASVSVVRNENGLVPLKQPKETTIAYVQIGEPAQSLFHEELKKNFNLESFIISLDESIDSDQLLKSLQKYPVVILAIYPLDPRRIEKIRLLNPQKMAEELKHFRVHGMSSSILTLVKALEAIQKKSIVTFFGNPFGLPFIKGFSSVIMGYEDESDAQAAALQILLGK